jgi:dTDP-4-amino-4,6-dideoxygalactose transaminase
VINKFDIFKLRKRSKGLIVDHPFGEFKRLDRKEIQAVERVISSGNLFRYQAEESECLKAEKEFAQKLGADYAVLVTSGTNALVCALLAGGILPGDEVIIPCYTFVATATAVIQAGAIPVVVNIDGELGLSPKSVSEKIGPRTKAIIAVHMDGLSCDILSVQKLARSKNLLLIEDCCQALGGQVDGKSLGTFGDFGCFSLNVDKILTCGEGGVVLTNNREEYEKLCSFSDGAFSFSPHHKNFYKQTAPILGLSMRVSEITGAILREQIKKLDTVLLMLKSIKEFLLSDCLNLKNLKILKGYDAKGECASSIMIQCESIKQAKLLGDLMRKEGVKAFPPSLRPAHVAWKWTPSVSDDKNFLGKNINNVIVNYMESVDIISRTLRVELDLDWSEDDLKKLRKSINRSFRIADEKKTISN